MPLGRGIGWLVASKHSPGYYFYSLVEPIQNKIFELKNSSLKTTYGTVPIVGGGVERRDKQTGGEQQRGEQAGEQGVRDGKSKAEARGEGERVQSRRTNW